MTPSWNLMITGVLGAPACLETKPWLLAHWVVLEDGEFLGLLWASIFAYGRPPSGV
ncbi:hypothetical protein NPIL_237641, partial [Nephila pilipes]